MYARVREIFHSELFRRLKPVPWKEELSPIPQKQIHFLVRLRPKSGRSERYATVALPGSRRLYELPSLGGARCMIRKDDVAKLFLPLLFTEDKVEEASTFRLLRNQYFDPGRGRRRGPPPSGNAA
jgi:polyphosphate kinase